MRSVTGNHDTGIRGWIDQHVNIRHRRRRRDNHRSRHRTGPNPYRRGTKYVIFPENRIIQTWDFIMILSIWYCAFFIPFRFGISGGYYTGQYERCSIPA
jgi:hypothetical protein